MNLKNVRNVVLGVVSVLSINVASAMVCVTIEDGKSYPLDKEAIDLVAALKPASNCDGKQVTNGAKLMGKTIVKRPATEQEATKIRAAIKERQDVRLKKRLLKAGLVK